jgi:cytochrome c553
MSVAARTLSDADIRDLAAYYGAIKVEVTLPQ